MPPPININPPPHLFRRRLHIKYFNKLPPLTCRRHSMSLPSVPYPPCSCHGMSSATTSILFKNPHVIIFPAKHTLLHPNWHHNISVTQASLPPFYIPHHTIYLTCIHPPPPSSSSHYLVCDCEYLYLLGWKAVTHIWNHPYWIYLLCYAFMFSLLRYTLLAPLLPLHYTPLLYIMICSLHLDMLTIISPD